MSKSNNRGTSVSRYNMMATFGSGKAGNVRLYQKGNKTYIRAAYNSASTNPRSEAQMRHRLKWANMSKVWPVLAPYLQRSFEGTSPSVSTCNLFMKANRGNGIYLTKEANEKNYMKAQPFVVSNGTLDSITISVVAGTNEWYVHTNLLLLIGSDVSTIGKLSTSLLTSNPLTLTEGDKITFVVVRELQRTTPGAVPFLRPEVYSFTLNEADDTPNNRFVMNGSFLAVAPTKNTNNDKVSATCILSRLENGKLRVSSQSLVCNENCNYSDFLTQDAYETAAASYGPATQVYINPRTGATLCNVKVSVDSSSSSMGSVRIGETDGVTQGNFEIGATITIKATANSGYTFSRWSDGSTLAERTITVEGSTVYTAEFTA